VWDKARVWRIQVCQFPAAMSQNRSIFSSSSPSPDFHFLKSLLRYAKAFYLLQVQKRRHIILANGKFQFIAQVNTPHNDRA